MKHTLFLVYRKDFSNASWHICIRTSSYERKSTPALNKYDANMKTQLCEVQKRNEPHLGGPRETMTYIIEMDYLDYLKNAHKVCGWTIWNVECDIWGVWGSPGDHDIYRRNGLFGLFEECMQSVRVDYMKRGMWYIRTLGVPGRPWYIS